MASSESRIFKIPEGITVDMLCDTIENYLRLNKGMVTQSFRSSDNVLIQGHLPSDGWRTISGTDQAITVQMFINGDVATVNAGFGKWSDKIGAGVVGWFLFAPLAITAAVGAYNQNKLPGEILDFINIYIMTGGKTGYAPTPGSSTASSTTSTAEPTPSSTVIDGVACPSCKTVNPKENKFCVKCGTKLLTCASCGALLEPDDNFCPKCGAPVEQKPNVCPTCGADIAEGQNFCPKCGTKLV